MFHGRWEACAHCQSYDDKDVDDDVNDDDDDDDYRWFIAKIKTYSLYVRYV